MKRIAKQVNDEGKDFGLEVVDVRIKRADLPQQNSKSVFDRMRAERQREAAEFRATGAAEANRIRSTADREATVIKAEAHAKVEKCCAVKATPNATRSSPRLMAATLSSSAF